MTKPITVMCVDDHPLMRDGIAFALQQETDIVLVAQAGSGADAIKAFRQHRPDVTLMDLQMPEMNGIEAMRAILAEFPRACIVVLTTYSGDIQASRALTLGAMGYLLKGLLRTDLVKTIRATHAGKRCIPQQVAYEIATHLTVDHLSERRLPNYSSGCGRQFQQGDRRWFGYYRRHREGAYAKRSIEASGQ